MLPRADVVHALPGRTRIRVRERLHDVEYFERVVRSLRSMDGAGEVTASHKTGSVLVVHRDSWEALGAYAKGQELFDLAPPPPPSHPEPPRPLPRMVGDALQVADLGLRVETGGRVDLASATFGALVAGAVVQAFRGQFLPASATLLAYAMRLVPGPARR
jgi:hypothetical protein